MICPRWHSRSVAALRLELMSDQFKSLCSYHDTDSTHMEGYLLGRRRDLSSVQTRGSRIAELGAKAPVAFFIGSPGSFLLPTYSPVFQATGHPVQRSNAPSLSPPLRTRTSRTSERVEVATLSFWGLLAARRLMWELKVRGKGFEWRVGQGLGLSERQGGVRGVLQKASATPLPTHFLLAMETEAQGRQMDKTEPHTHECALCTRLSARLFHICCNGICAPPPGRL